MSDSGIVYNGIKRQEGIHVCVYIYDDDMASANYLC